MVWNSWVHGWLVGSLEVRQPIRTSLRSQCTNLYRRVTTTTTTYESSVIVNVGAVVSCCVNRLLPRSKFQSQKSTMRIKAKVNIFYSKYE